ncbi:MAG: AraC family transcriptional regulator [Oscillospiraceae bacterium]
MKYELSSIAMLPKGVKNPIFEQRETGQTHTPYQAEIRFYSCIKEGNSELLINEMDSFFKSGFVIGRMSDNDLRQMQYWATSCIAIGIRYAIQGGLDEMKAFNFADKCIETIDKFVLPEQVVEFLPKKAIELTEMVNRLKISVTYSYHIKICIDYINKNLHNKITVEMLSKVCKLSESYLSVLFKKETGINISKYILKKKLEVAKALINEKYDCGEIVYSLDFCSQSHFISCFKKEYGITPSAYATSLK